MNDQLDGAVQSVAEAYPAPESDDAEQNEEEEPTFIASRPVASDTPEDVPETPTLFVPNNNKKTQVQVQLDEEDEEDEDIVPVRSSNRGAAAGNTYFPVHFGSTNGGAIAIANSYSTGKGESFLIVPMTCLEMVCFIEI